MVRKTENKFQADLIIEIRNMFPRCMILKNDPNYIQGIPDLTIENGVKYAKLEVKESRDAPYRPNQKYYLEYYASMGAFASVIYPENEKEVLAALVLYFNGEYDAGPQPFCV